MASRKPALARSDSEDGDTRTVARSGQMRADAYVDDVVQTWNLPDLTDTYDYVTPLSEGNQGDVYFMLNKAKPYALKIYKTGVNRQYTEFQKDLLRNIDNPEAKAHPGYEAVYFAAMPVGWAIHMGKKGLVFRYVTPPRKSRRPTAEDRAQVRDQIDFLHWLGYVHLDITDRNIMLADRGRCYLMDYDCVCKIDEVPLGPVPTESTEAILTQRFPAEIDDDEHLWQLLQTTFFHELPVDEAYLVPVQLSSGARMSMYDVLCASFVSRIFRVIQRFGNFLQYCHVPCYLIFLVVRIWFIVSAKPSDAKTALGMLMSRGRDIDGLP